MKKNRFLDYTFLVYLCSHSFHSISFGVRYREPQTQSTQYQVSITLFAAPPPLEITTCTYARTVQPKTKPERPRLNRRPCSLQRNRSSEIAEKGSFLPRVFFCSICEDLLGRGK
jgi:hypothetical protein